MIKQFWGWLLVENHRKALSFLGTAIAVIVAAGWTYYTYIESVKQKAANAHEVVTPSVDRQTSDETAVPELAQAKKTVTTKRKEILSFAGTYVGISTEGSRQQPIKITFEKKGNKSMGTYMVSGMLGTMNGTISGTTYKYQWQLGGFSGRGVSYFRGHIVEGTWGYNNSDSNAGTITAQLQ